jgi:vancomycin permeability regulator SanA
LAKYYFNRISIKEFRFDYVGNILNLILTFTLIAGCLILTFSKRNVEVKRLNLLFAFQIFSIICLAAAYLSTYTGIVDASTFLFHHPAKKVYTGIFFVLSSLCQLYSMIYIWGLIFGPENLLELRTLIRTFGAVVLLLIFSLLYVWNVRVYDESKLADKSFNYGFVPGAAVYGNSRPSPVFEARIKKAYELYSKKIVKKLFLTGGSAPGELSEGEAAEIYLNKLGVPSKDVTIEERSTTTTEQIKYLRKKESVIKEEGPFVIISDGFHLTRIMQISKFFKLNTIGVSSDYTMSFEKALFYRARESVALLMFWFFAI